jgi:ADP-ribose pyrophosphatase
MKIIAQKVLHEEKWTLLKESSYRDLEGREGTWTYIERRGRQRAVVVVAATESSRSLVLIEQFRVPFGRPVVEFPAGLVDPGEELAQAARRELREETGFDGEVLEVGPEVSTTAGLSTETVHMVYMRVGETPAAAATPERSERISLRLLPPERFAGYLEESRREGRLLDAKLYVYLRQRAAQGGAACAEP